MIVAAVIVGAIPAVVTRLRRGYTVTPDGLQYAAMGRGESAPRPYELRSIAKWIPPTTEALTVVSSAGLLLSLIGLYVGTYPITGDDFAAFMACAMWGALPYTRRLLVWPVLTDAMSIGCVGLAGILATQNPNFLGVITLTFLILASQVIHERVTVHAALLAWFVTGSLLPFVPMVLGMAVYAVRYYSLPIHEQESTVPYLANPFGAWAEHRKAGVSFAVWLLPWGTLLAAALYPSWQLGVVALASYAPLAVSVDRVRCYQANPYPFVIAAVTDLRQVLDARL